MVNSKSFYGYFNQYAWYVTNFEIGIIENCENLYLKTLLL